MSTARLFAFLRDALKIAKNNEERHEIIEEMEHVNSSPTCPNCDSASQVWTDDDGVQRCHRLTCGCEV